MSTLPQLVAGELSRAAPPDARAISDAILAEHGASVACILFYGSRRRDGGGDGLLDLYVLFDRHAAFHRRRVAALFNRLLPPNVSFVAVATPTGTARAKVAVMSRSAFARRMQASSLDTTIWTRFCQPASLLHARDPGVADWAARTIADGLRTASGWAKLLAPPGAGPARRWGGLFARTYRLELRPEAANRSALVHEAAAGWFQAVAEITDAEHGNPASERSWRVREILGKPLNLLRLLKAAFTFEGGAEYLADKLGKHSGVPVSLTSWQKNHALLGAPGLLLAHRRALRRQRRRLG